MIVIEKKSDCSGCTACFSICPKNAIQMLPDAMGFLYPHVIKDDCVDCGLCESVCAFRPNYQRPEDTIPQLSYMVRHRDEYHLSTSRSGGAFAALSDWILMKDGVVYGAAFDDGFIVRHKRVNNCHDRDILKGSKYVQSDLRETFRSVKTDLENGKYVCFSGTPCQVAGLYSFIGKNLRSHLFLVDIVCHGVPSPSLWKDYLSYLRKKYGKEIVKVDFRDKKEFGWSEHKESYVLSDGSKRYETLFTYMFYEHIMFRQSCSVCHYANLDRVGDVTLADCWGWEKADPTFNADNKGVSLVLVNTRKGSDWLNVVKSSCIVKSVDIEMVKQPNMCHPSKQHPERYNFERDYVANKERLFATYNVASKWHLLKDILCKMYKRIR